MLHLLKRLSQLSSPNTSKFSLRQVHKYQALKSFNKGPQYNPYKSNYLNSK